MRRTVFLLFLLGALFAPLAARASNDVRVRDLVIHDGDVPRRLVGYGLVVGLDGTGDRSWGGVASHNMTVQSVVNLLRRFDIQVPPEYLRLRNVAAVLLTAEVSPYLRTGGRFEVQVSALGDATSLEGGVLWIAPLVSDPNQPPVATAQGPVLVSTGNRNKKTFYRGANSGRIPDGGILETDAPPAASTAPRLLLRKPDRLTAQRIALTVNRALGDGTARVEDPGSIALTLNDKDPGEILAGVDTLLVEVDVPARIIIHGREGTVVAGGDIRVGRAVVHHRGITLEVGGAPADSTSAQMPGLVQFDPRTTVEDIAAGLHAAGAEPREIASIFEALRDAGALNAEVIVR